MENIRVKKKVLIIEDEAPLLRALKDKFLKAGFETIEAQDGESGLELALKKRPDAILLDLLLPKLGGEELMKKLREDEWGKTAPVIVLTNVDRDDDLMRKVLMYKPSFYLIKADWKLLDNVIKKVNEVIQ